MDYRWDDLKAQALEAIDRLAGPMIELSDRISAHPELSFEERLASQWICEVFEEMDFEVERPFVGIETAFRARKVGKAGHPNLGFIVEYDALPELGHACGHNTKGSITWGAVAGILAALPDLPGSITVIGTPAEESGGGKVIMFERGAFEGLDVALAPSVGPTVMTGVPSLAVQGLRMNFAGRSSHANARPQEGRNALKACILTFNMIDALRQTFTGDVRINGIITDGGQSPGMIPERAAAHFNVGCRDGEMQRQLYEQVMDCALASCKITGCEVTFEPSLLYREMKLSRPLIELIESKMRELGLTVSPPGFGGGIGGTDMGQLSHQVPADTVYAGLGEHLMPHTHEYREACVSQVGHEAIVTCAKICALCGLEILTRPQTLAEIQRDFKAKP